MTRRDWLLTALPLGESTGAAWARRRDDAAPGDAAVLEAASGKTLVEQGDSRRAGLPGATLSPFVLVALLERGVLAAGERIACPGEFRLGERNLECAHAPNLGPLDAVEALAVSCNYWFAEMARRIGPEALLKTLRKAGLAAQHAPDNEQLCLQTLGLAHVSASPRSLAHAYAWLLRTGPPALVLAGLRTAVERGTAQRALSPHVWIAGKAGTAPGGLPGSSAGWFAGWAMPAGRNGCPAEQTAACLHTRPAIAFAIRIAGETGGGAADLGKVLAERWGRES